MNKHFLFAVFCLVLPGFLIHAQGIAERETVRGTAAQVQNAQNTAELPLKRIALFSSGVAYFEHSGTVSGQAEILLPFDAGAVNDALKSLVINDQVSNGSPSVHYASQNTLERTLKSLKIDLSGMPGIGEILNNQKGAELEVSAPNAIRGRIIGVEYRQGATHFTEQYYMYNPQARPPEEAWLSMFTTQGIRMIAVKDISSFRFVDEQINTDLVRALDLIMASRDENTRNLLVSLPGDSRRDVSLSYVIPAPIWKVSYRLDLSGKAPFLQGWAIVDNDSDTDWNGVQLSLVTGRPVSFIQTLYPPSHRYRPVVPLSIAGIAESRTYDSGYAQENARAKAAMDMVMEMEAAGNSRNVLPQSAPVPAPPPRGVEAQASSVTGGTMQTASGSSLGDQFEFTIKNPVSLERRQSAMLPLVEGTVKAEKTLVLSGNRTLNGATIHPGICAELTNTSGMKLPAGPITVYDGGNYAGDALIEFFPENEKRLISYGDDLSVTGNSVYSGTRYVTAVNIIGGVMTISRRQSHEREYTIRNASEEAKKLIIEHSITSGSELVEPKTADDRTTNLYRFNRELAAKTSISFKVREETPVSERVTLASLRPDAFLSYSTNQEIPANVRTVLARAIQLKGIADNAAVAQTQIEAQRTRLVSEQDRIRRNLEAAGNQSPQGQEYLKRLSDLDKEIDKLNVDIDAAIKETERAKREYDNYLATINI
jgi:hypothetical protein